MTDLRDTIARAIYTSKEFAAAAAFGVPIDAKTVCAEGIADAVISILGMREEWMVHWPIASAPDRLDKMEKALRAVLERHRPRPNTVSALSPYPLCECGLEWGDDGCPTVTTIREALSDE